MTYEELKIQLDLNKPIDILKSIGGKTKDNDWFIVCDEGDCYLFDDNGNEIDIKKIKSLNKDLIPKDIKKIIIPDSIEYIEDSTFYNCQNLTSINIPDSIKNIKTNVFTHCKSLTAVSISNSVKIINFFAFLGCENLTLINIPDSVESIGHHAFSHCKSLTSITIPDSVESIESHAFYNCIKLKEMIFEGKTIDQVKSMKHYPWGIEDKSIIRCIS